MRISAKADYAIRAAVELARREGSTKAELIAAEQLIPLPFLAKILTALRAGGLVVSVRGPDGGHRLSRDPAAITLGDVVRVVDGPLTDVAGQPPAELDPTTVAGQLRDVWLALDAASASVLDAVSVAAVASGEVPERIVAMARPGAASALLEAN